MSKNRQIYGIMLLTNLLLKIYKVRPKKYLSLIKRSKQSL